MRRMQCSAGVLWTWKPKWPKFGLIQVSSSYQELQIDSTWKGQNIRCLESNRQCSQLVKLVPLFIPQGKDIHHSLGMQFLTLSKCYRSVRASQMCDLVSCLCQCTICTICRFWMIWGTNPLAELPEWLELLTLPMQHTHHTCIAHATYAATCATGFFDVLCWCKAQWVDQCFSGLQKLEEKTAWSGLQI